MADYTYTDLKKKTAAQLKEIAAGIEHEAVQGYTQQNKDHLIKAICTALHIDMHAHHEVVGLNKAELKSKIKELKKTRDAALEKNDHKKLITVRKEIKSLKNQLRRATV
jgi:protein-arginine kinase activator protein McsA